MPYALPLWCTCSWVCMHIKSLLEVILTNVYSNGYRMCIITYMDGDGIRYKTLLSAFSVKNLIACSNSHYYVLIAIRYRYTLHSSSHLSKQAVRGKQSIVRGSGDNICNIILLLSDSPPGGDQYGGCPRVSYTYVCSPPHTIITRSWI